MGTDDLNTGDASGIDQPDQGCGDVSDQSPVLTPYQLWKIKYLSVPQKIFWYRWGCLAYFLPFLFWLLLMFAASLAGDYFLLILESAPVIASLSLMFVEAYLCLFLPARLFRQAYADPETTGIFLDPKLTARAYRELSLVTFLVSITPFICVMMFDFLISPEELPFGGLLPVSADQWIMSILAFITFSWPLVMFTGLSTAIFYKKPSVPWFVLGLWVIPMLIISPIVWTRIFLNFGITRAFEQYGQAYPLFLDEDLVLNRGLLWGILVPTIVAALWYVSVLIYLSVKRKSDG
jgi:hypothetical protein